MSRAVGASAPQPALAAQRRRSAAGGAGSAGGGGRLAARCVLLSSGEELSPGEVVWDAAGRIVALRRPTGRVADLCVLPGLVNAHAHLQIEPVEAPRSFLPWVGAVLAARGAQTAGDQVAAARAALRSLLEAGTTSIGEIDSTGRSPAVLQASAMAGRCYQELTGFHLDAAAARQLVRVRQAAAVGAMAAGLSPHAPYSVSAALFQAAAASVRHLTIHCAELPEEQQFLHTGTGPFAELLQRLGRLPEGYRPPGVGAVAWLDRLGILRPGTQLVHCQELERGDAPRLAATGVAIVVCPGTIRWFRRTPPPVPAWLAAGIPVALGTDSRASNETFSLRAELALAARLWPELSPAQLFTMATAAGGRALGRPGLGRLRRGGRADLIAVPATSDSAVEHLEAFLHGGLPLERIVVGGRRLRARALRR